MNETSRRKIALFTPLMVLRFDTFIAPRVKQLMEQGKELGEALDIARNEMLYASELN